MNEYGSAAEVNPLDVLKSIERAAHRGQCWVQVGDGKPVAIMVTDPAPKETER